MQSLGNWLSLSWDHLVPKGHPNRDASEFIVTACMFCNTADKRYFDLAEKCGLTLDGLTPDQLVAQRLSYVEATRNSYQEFWKAKRAGGVRPLSRTSCARFPTSLPRGQRTRRS